MKNYGKELIIDLHNCNPDKFTRTSITRYFKELCNIIQMERESLYFWDYEGDPSGYAAAPAHLKGVSAIQFIKTSNITIHTLDVLKKVYLNVFSCKDFDPKVVEQFSAKWFGGKIANSRLTERL